MTCPRAGFTLIESSVALLLLAMTTLLALDLFHLAGRALNQQPASAETTRLLELVRGRIAGAYPAWVADGPALPHVDFLGSDHLIELIGPAPEALSPGAIARWRLALVPGPGGTERLEISVRGAPAEALPLVGHASSFAYFGQTDPAAPPAWHAAWQSQSAMPLLVRLQLGTLPEILVHPLLSPREDCAGTGRGCAPTR